MAPFNPLTMDLSVRAEQYSEAYLNTYRGYILQDLSIAFIVITAIFVALRYYARFLARADFAMDDYILFGGFISNVALCFASIRIVQAGGVGWHEPRVLQDNPALMVGWGKGLYAIELIYLTAVALPKLSALIFYLRIFITRDAKGWLKQLAYATGILIIANYAAFIIAAIFQCNPVPYWWTRFDPALKGHVKGKCFNVQAFYRAMCVPNLFTDVAVLLLPVGSIMKLNLPNAKKISLSLIFLTAGVGIVASALRFKTFFDVDAFSDATWSSVPLISWSVVEAGFYTIAACLPHLRPVFAKHCPSWLNAMFSSTFNQSNKGNTYEMKRSRRDKESQLGYSQLDSPRDLGRQQPNAWQGGKGSSEFKFEATASAERPGRNHPRSVPIEGINMHREVLVSRGR